MGELTLFGNRESGRPEQVAIPPMVRGWLERIRALPGWRHPYD